MSFKSMEEDGFKSVLALRSRFASPGDFDTAVRAPFAHLIG